MNELAKQIWIEAVNRRGDLTIEHIEAVLDRDDLIEQHRKANRWIAALAGLSSAIGSADLARYIAAEHMAGRWPHD